MIAALRTLLSAADSATNRVQTEKSRLFIIP